MHHRIICVFQEQFGQTLVKNALGRVDPAPRQGKLLGFASAKMLKDGPESLLKSFLRHFLNDKV